VGAGADNHNEAIKKMIMIIKVELNTINMKFHLSKVKRSTLAVA
jgi:hypothetical protein